jgi:hypothetical protein
VARGRPYLGHHCCAIPAILDAHGRTPRLLVSLTTLYHSDILANPIDALRAFLDRVKVVEITATPFFSPAISDTAYCIGKFSRVQRVEITMPVVGQFQGQFRENLVRLLRAVESTQYIKQIEVSGETYDLFHG